MLSASWKVIPLTEYKYEGYSDGNTLTRVSF